MTYEINTRRMQRTNTAVVRTRVSMEDIGKVMPEIFREVYEYLERNHIPSLGQAFGCYVIHPKENQVEIEAGFTTAVPVQPNGRVEASSLPEGEVAVCLFLGPYDQIAPAYAAASEWMQAHGLQQAGPSWEVYLSMPDETPQRTEIYFPLKTDDPRPI